MTAEIAATEKKLLAAIRYEHSGPADARRIRIAATLTNAHWRKLERLAPDLSVLSPKGREAVEYLRRAS